MYILLSLMQLSFIEVNNWCCASATLYLVLIACIFTFIHMRSQQDLNSKWNIGLIVSIAYFVLITAILLNAEEWIYYGIINIITLSSCRAHLYCNVSLYFILKFAVYLFLAFRSTIAVPSKAIWFKIGLCLISTIIICFVAWLYTAMSSKRELFIINGLCIYASDGVIGTWLLCTDFVIGVYYIIMFFFPFKHL
eukprot:250828_1